MRNVIVYRLPQHFGSGGIISLSFWMYMGLMMLYWNTNSRATGAWPHQIVMAIEKLKRYKSSGIDKIPVELIKR
jgi:hypothetical protein